MARAAKEKLAKFQQDGEVRRQLIRGLQRAGSERSAAQWQDEAPQPSAHVLLQLKAGEAAELLCRVRETLVDMD